MDKKGGKKLRNHDINPCLEESDASSRCLDAYNYDKSKCYAYFTKYKDCRKYWHNVMVERRRNGVKPEMPPLAERQQMLADIGGTPY